ncbi:hydroxysteroid 11-beta-dehydrogenase 1-like protein isoform X1 [Sciurus carolinensis]|uniref:hydroxysteroid 11-beta-dehydrogenase 1-like protein isoform X1 n=1 Tax=Sciurus carolinensis TaxID=30640 RepID=UPI001FB229CD|nr:hydroxysteroid 11-beta-dehydrogenase 1-like protein isoform X1 [Sciurus carolinensis]
MIVGRWTRWWPEGQGGGSGPGPQCYHQMKTHHTGVAVGQPAPAAGARAMKVLLLTGLGALLFAYYWDDSFDPASLQGARVLLTGASAGVGEELAYHYARLGSHLVLTAHTEALLQKVVGNCRKLGAPKVFYIAADMASPEAPEHVVQFALDKLGGLDYLVLNHIGGAPAGMRVRSAQATHWLMQVPRFFRGPAPPLLALPAGARLSQPEAPPERQGAPSSLPRLLPNDVRAPPLRILGSAPPDLGSTLAWSSNPPLSSGPALLGWAPPVPCDSTSPPAGHVPTSFSTPYSAAKFALDGFFGSLRRELDVQDVNVAITMCVLGLWDRASTVEGVRGVARAKASPGPKAALAVIRGGATRTACVFYPWRFHLLCLLRGWLPHPRAWFIRQDLNISAAVAA